jgi:hypothetical protein
MARVRSLLGTVGRVVRGAFDALWRALSSDPEDRPWERAAVRIVVPFAFVSAGLVATLVAYRTDRPPAWAFENSLVFAGVLLLFGFYGVLLIFVPLVRAVASGELPIELTARGARFTEKGADDSLVANRELFERVQTIEADLAEQEARSESDGRQAARSVIDFEGDLGGLRARLDAVERKVE